nr:immunoglobulin heavy chain junction region [Macaca mulatta]
CARGKNYGDYYGLDSW